MLWACLYLKDAMLHYHDSRMEFNVVNKYQSSSRLLPFHQNVLIFRLNLPIMPFNHKLNKTGKNETIENN